MLGAYTFVGIILALRVYSNKSFLKMSIVEFNCSTALRMSEPLHSTKYAVLTS